MIEDLYSKVNELNDYYIKVWEDVCNIESPTKFKQGVDQVGEYFVNLAKERGWEVEVLKQDVAGNAISITLNPDASGKCICLSGHIDTVHPVGLFGNPPVRIENDKIYGPGVVDCKGGVVAAFYAMEVLDKCGFKSRPVQLLIQSDEEVGSKLSNKATINYICEKAKGAELFLNLEPHVPDNVTLSRKGIISFRFDVTGKEGHSSRCAVEGANAIVDASNKIIELDKIKDNEGITCNCALVEGGSVLNTIPGKCSFSVNFRYSTQEQLVWIEDYVKKLANTVHVPGCKCEVTMIGERPAMEYSEDNAKLLEKVNSIFLENGIKRLNAVKANGGSDAAYITMCGIPCLDSLGVVGEGLHSVNEFSYIDSLAECAKRIITIANFI